jgi:hypothetical protein
VRARSQKVSPLCRQGTSERKRSLSNDLCHHFPAHYTFPTPISSLIFALCVAPWRRGSPGKSIFDAANEKSLLFCRLSLEYANSHAQTPGEQQQSLFNASAHKIIFIKINASPE